MGDIIDLPEKNRTGTHGGKRPGAGRPKGSVKEIHHQRPQHQVRAFEGEWELISHFAFLVKHGKIEACRKALQRLDAGAGTKAQ